MKTYKLSGTEWVSEKPLTKEQSRAMFNMKFTKGEKPEPIVRETEKASVEDSAKLNAVWEANKPTEEGYQLIEASITLDGDNARGIINYRVKGEHLQKRF
jgi:hypothetical protein